jgi:hypothetical protein
MSVPMRATRTKSPSLKALPLLATTRLVTGRLLDSVQVKANSTWKMPTNKERSRTRTRAHKVRVVGHRQG